LVSLPAFKLKIEDMFFEDEAYLSGVLGWLLALLENIRLGQSVF
jgi:hypothetical protein